MKKNQNEDSAANLQPGGAQKAMSQVKVLMSLRRKKQREQALANVNKAIIAAKSYFQANEDSDIDFELSEALAHANTAFDYLEASVSAASSDRLA